MIGVQSTTAGQSIGFELKKLFKISSDFKNHIILAEVEKIRVDNHNNIYLLDYGSMEIHKFNKEGKYMFSFGGRGRGPGEFVHMTAITIAGGKIYIMDGPLSKIEVFNLKGEHIKTLMSRERFGFTVSGFHKDEGYFYFAKISDRGSNTKKLLSVFSTKKEKVINRYISIDKLDGYEQADELGGSEPAWKVILGSYPGEFIYSKDTIYYMPYTFEDVIYYFHSGILTPIKLSKNRSKSFEAAVNENEIEADRGYYGPGYTYHIIHFQVSGTFFKQGQELYVFYWKRLFQGDDRLWQLNIYNYNTKTENTFQISNIIRRTKIPFTDESIYIKDERLYLISGDQTKVNVYKIF